MASVDLAVNSGVNSAAKMRSSDALDGPPGFALLSRARCAWQRQCISALWGWGVVLLRGGTICIRRTTVSMVRQTLVPRAVLSCAFAP